MSNTTTDGPVGGSNVTLLANRYLFAALVIETIGFGAYLVVAGMTIHLILGSRKGTSRGRIITLTYTMVMLLTTLAGYYTTVRPAEAMLVEAPASNIVVYSVTSLCSPTVVASDALSLFQFWGSDALVIWRMYVIFNKQWRWIMLPVLLFLVNIALGILISLACDSPQFGGHIAIGNLTDEALAFYALTAGMNLLVTFMISGRLMLHRYRMQTAFGISQASMRGGGQYLTIVGVLIESAFVYAGVCTVFVILLHKNSPATGWWNGIVTAASYLCQSWIILRIVLGTAVSSTTIGVASRPTIQPISFTGAARNTNQGTGIGTEREDPMWHRDKHSHVADAGSQTNMELTTFDSSV